MTDNKDIPGINFTGDIHIAGDMFNIHDNQIVTINMNGQPDKEKQLSNRDAVSDYLDLVFFTDFDTLEKQKVLREVLREIAKKIDVDAGRDWVAVYIAYSFYRDTLKLTKRYVDFFTDIEALLPDTLTKIKQDEKGDKRYRSYTESLSGECEKWYVDSNCLPSINVWKSSNCRYGVTEDRKREVQQLVTEIYKKLKQD